MFTSLQSISVRCPMLEPKRNSSVKQSTDDDREKTRNMLPRPRHEHRNDAPVQRLLEKTGAHLGGQTSHDREANGRHRYPAHSKETRQTIKSWLSTFIFASTMYHYLTRPSPTDSRCVDSSGARYRRLDQQTLYHYLLRHSLA